MRRFFGRSPVRLLTREGSKPLLDLFATAIVAAAVALCHGCSGGDAITLPEGHGSLRLVDYVSIAGVTSPLNEVEPIASIDEIIGIEPTRTVPGQPVTSQSKRCRSEKNAEGGLEVVCDGGGIEGWWAVPVAADSYSRIQLNVSTDETECFEVIVQNGKQEEIFLRLDEHSSDRWQRLSTTVVAATEWGAGLRVRVRSQPGRQDCEMRIKDVLGEEFELGVDQELGLLKAQSLLPQSDPMLGLAKIGIMMPTARGGRVTAPFDDNFTITEAILAPSPTEVTYRIDVPNRSRLLFTYGPHRGSQLGDAVGFEVRVKRRWRDAEIIWTDVVTADDANWYWHGAEIDLTRFSGKKVDLTLRSFAPNGGRAYAVWGVPTLDVPRELIGPPNIIVVAVDTLRADRLSCYGYPGSVSPNIDALAAEGVRFDRTFAQSNWTCPSFASIFSGLTVGAHGMIGLLDKFSPSVTTLAESLRGAGWSTHAIAYKPALAGRGYEQGFETYFNIPKVVHSAQENLSKAIEFLNQNHDRRFFLFLHFNDPHQPFTHPVPFFSAESEADTNHFGMTRPVWIYPDLRNCSGCGVPGARDSRFDSMGRRMYVEEIRYLDDRIGALVEELKLRNLYEDSVIVFVSDHGEALWDHYNQYGHGGKNHHDELIRVPLIIKPHRSWGGATDAVVTSQVRAFDLMPTLLEMAGVGVVSRDLEAESLVPMLREPQAEKTARLVVSTNEFASAVRTASWKYIRPLLPHSGSEQLFDLEADPGEYVDVAQQRPDVLREMRREAAEHILLRHGGVFILVVRNEGDHSIRIRWGADAKLEQAGHVGLPLAEDVADGRLRFKTSDFVFEGPVGVGPLALLAGFMVPDGAEVQVSVDAGPDVKVIEFPVYNNGDLRRILEIGDPGIYGFTSPGRSYRSLENAHQGETRVDAQQLEALRALGYVDE